MEDKEKKLEIWKLILSGHKATASWGIKSDTLCRIENGISFRLEGEKYDGWVEIVFDNIDNCFNVFFRNSEELKLIESISTSEMIAATRNPPKDIDADQLETARKEFGFTKS